MFKNYLKIAFRNLIKHKAFSFINISGLAIGMASCVLILLYIADELSYDRFHEKTGRIYRVNLSGNWAGEELRGSGTPPPLAAALVNEFPEVETSTRIYPPGNIVVHYNDDFFTETGVLGVDPNFFKVFSFELLEGDPATALNDPNTLILTQETAQKYFGNEPVMGKIMVMADDNKAFTVTGIVKGPPS